MLREKLAPKSKVAKEKKKPDEDPLVTVTKRYDRLVKNLEEYDNEEILQLYLTSLASLYDPHSTYMSASTLEDFSIGIKLALVGIGAVLASEDGYCVIKELVPGGPADLDGRLKVGDKIIGVAQGENAFDDIVDMKLRNAVKKIRGPKNTIVRLQVIPAGSNAGEQREVQITRDEVKLAAQQATASVYDIPKPPQTKSIPIDADKKPKETKAAHESWWDKTVGHGLNQPVDHTNFNQRYGPSVTTYGPGVAGYGGFKPHGTTTGNLEAHSYLSGMHEPQKQPYVMPPPGYAGHLRNANAGDATSTWGTSHWKIGQTPKGVGSPTRSPPKGPTMSPEQLAEKRDMDEANELLDLRSLGIRAALKVAQPQGSGGLSF
jgi:hypothetical protein